MFATAVFSPYFSLLSSPDCAAQNSEIGGKLVGQDFLLLVLSHFGMPTEVPTWEPVQVLRLWRRKRPLNLLRLIVYQVCFLGKQSEI